jgi:UDP-glucose 4-epimerase
MRHEFQARDPEASEKIKFYIGDVRDLASVKNAMHGVDYIFHAAALKQVPSCEFFPIEAVKTNVLGTENVLVAAILRDKTVIIPRGQDTIEAGDSVIIVSSHLGLRDITDYLR